MNKNKKINLIISIALISILLIIGVSYAALTYTETSSSQELVLGDIWMKYTESNGISLENSLPGDNYSNYFEFTIDGTNTYTKKDIWYDIRLVKGDVPAGKTEDNRIEDKYLKFKLVEVNGTEETEIFTDKTYIDLTNQMVHVATISKNTNEYLKTYRLYMVISEELVIGNVEGAISLEEFANLFGSIKVNVTGDFNEKEITYEDKYGVMDDKCFSYQIEYGGNAYKKTMISPYRFNDLTNDSERLNTCIGYIFSLYGYSEIDENDSSYSRVKSICSGEQVEGIGFKEFLAMVQPTTIVHYEYLLDEGIITMGEYVLNDLTNDSEKLAICTDYSVSLTGAEEGTAEYEQYYLLANSLCSGGEYEGMNLVELYTYFSSEGASVDYGYLEENDILYFEELEGEVELEYQYISSDNGNTLNINNIDKSQATITLSDYNDESCGKDLVIPKQLQDINVRKIHFPNPLNFALEYNLDTLVIPNSVVEIGTYAFFGADLSEIIFEENSQLTTIQNVAFGVNNLKSIILPDSITYIGGGAFTSNNLKTVVIESKNINIGGNAFGKSSESNSNLESITFTSKTCEEIKNIVHYNGSSNSNFPWLDSSSPYYVEGYKAKIIGTDGECSY